jgi:hypothetical protein
LGAWARGVAESPRGVAGKQALPGSFSGALAAVRKPGKFSAIRAAVAQARALP